MVLKMFSSYIDHPARKPIACRPTKKKRREASATEAKQS